MGKKTIKNCTISNYRYIFRKNLPVPQLPRSQIERLFGGNYCSTLICPGCSRGKHSTDPFLCLSLPIPIETTKRPLYPIVYYLSGEVSRIGVAPNLEANASSFRQMIAKEMGVHQRLLAFTTIYPNGFGRRKNSCLQFMNYKS